MRRITVGKEVDAKDRAILGVLATNAKASVQELAALTHIPPTTVHQRIKRLEREGIIQGYRAVIDERALGVKFRAMVLCNADSHLPAHTRSIQAIKRVEALVGDHDYLLELSAASMDELHMTLRYLKRIDGVANVHMELLLEHNA